MCRTDESISSVCGHMAAYTEECRYKRTPMLISVLVYGRRCKHMINTVAIHEMCPKCRKDWEDCGIDELEAVQSTRAYREAHEYYGPLSPHSFQGAKPILMEELDLDESDTALSRKKTFQDRLVEVVWACTPSLSWLIDGSTAQGLDSYKELVEREVRKATKDPSPCSTPWTESPQTIWHRIPHDGCSQDEEKGMPQLWHRILDKRRYQNKVKGRVNDELGTGLPEVGDSRNLIPPATTSADGFEMQVLYSPKPRQVVPNALLLSDYSDFAQEQQDKSLPQQLSEDIRDKPVGSPSNS